MLLEETQHGFYLHYVFVGRNFLNFIYTNEL